MINKYAHFFMKFYLAHVNAYTIYIISTTFCFLESEIHKFIINLKHIVAIIYTIHDLETTTKKLQPQQKAKKNTKM